MANRHRAREALARQHKELDQFKLTLDQTVDCVFMCRASDFRLVYVNEGATKQVGYSEAELLEMTPLDITPEFTEQSYRELVQPLLDGVLPSLTFDNHPDGGAAFFFILHVRVPSTPRSNGRPVCSSARTIPTW